MNKQVSFAGAMSILGLLVILAAAPTQADAADVGHVVKTKSGKVSGTTVEDGGENVRIFKGIPYAAPPVGEWRWKAPQPVKPWSDVRDGAKWSNQCAQRAGSRMGVSGQISEDCLYLNVVTAARTTSEKRPVMVFFHGGGLTSGTGNSLTYSRMCQPAGAICLAWPFTVSNYPMCSVISRMDLRRRHSCISRRAGVATRPTRSLISWITR